jgi:hypothetical protein
MVFFYLRGMAEQVDDELHQPLQILQQLPSRIQLLFLEDIADVTRNDGLITVKIG